MKTIACACMFVLLAFLAAPKAHAAEPLSGVEIGKEVLFLGLLAADYKQTARIDGFCNGRSGCTIHETNSLISSTGQPSRRDVNQYFAAVAIGHLAALYLLPVEYRGWIQNSSLALEITVVAHNKRIGLGWGF